MAVEIERRFLVAHDGWRKAVSHSARIQDGLIATFNDRKTRVRIIGNRATLTVKGRRHGFARAEFEYEIPVADAEEMVRTMCDGRVLEKTRSYVRYGGLTWEIDVYDGLLQGVVVAEVELNRADCELLLPDWVGREITGDARYSKLKLLEARTVERLDKAG